MTTVICNGIDECNLSDSCEHAKEHEVVRSRSKPYLSCEDLVCDEAYPAKCCDKNDLN